MYTRGISNGETENNISEELTLERCGQSYVVHSPTNTFIVNAIAACVVHVFLFIFGTVLNSIVVVTFWTSKSLRSKLSVFTIMILSSNDLGVVTMTHPIFITQGIQEITRQPSCKFEGVSDLFGTLVVGFSLSTLCVMNSERYLCIVYPMWHKVNVTRQRLLLVCVLLWSLVLLNTAPCYQHGKICVTVIVPTFSITVSYFSLFVYASIFRVVRSRKRLNKIRSLFAGCDCAQMQKNFTFLRDLKVARNYLHIVTLTCVSYIPVTLCKLMQSNIKTGRQTSAGLAIAQIWGETLVVSLSTFNCIIFFWNNRELRRAGLKTIKLLLRTT